MGVIRIHELKVWPEYFAALLLGEKTFELRRDDREGGFNVGDSLKLREYEPWGHYTGREIHARVSYVLSGVHGLLPGYAVLGLGPR